MLAVQADGAEVTTIEGCEDGELEPLPAGVPRQPLVPVRLLHAGLRDDRDRAAAGEPAARATSEIREAISGNLCRCTGYESIVAAIALAAERGA